MEFSFVLRQVGEKIEAVPKGPMAKFGQNEVVWFGLILQWRFLG